MQALKNRTDIPTEFTWNLQTIFASNEDWERTFKSLQQCLPELESLQGTLAQSGEALLAVLQKRDEIYKQLEHLYVYASMRRDEDTTNSTYQGMADRAMQLYVQISTVASYIEPEILAIPEATFERFFKETPGLELYRQQLNDLSRKRGHVRSAEIRSTDRRVRKDAFEGLHGTFLKQRNTIASTLASQVRSDIFYARQRNYTSCLENALARYNIPVSVYDMLVDTVSEHIPLLNRYLKLRKRVLKLDEMHMYDLYVPIVEETKEEVSYQQARETVVAALAQLGEDYTTTLRQGFAQRWIDVYETPGKRGGAYSGGAYGTQPFILLNYQNNRDSMYTLAHELGHSMHSFYTRNYQPYQYGDYTIFVAEVASTLNEELLTEYLLKKTTDRALRLAILNHSLEGFRGTLFRQTMFAEFEQQIHNRAEQGEPLTADMLSALYHILNEKYYGGETVIDELINVEWARIPHFYSSFYVYQYATGISAACALVQQILHEGKPAVDRYLRFLRSGSSDYSIDLLKKAGVDMTSPEPVRQALQLFESHLAQMEELL